MAFTTPKMALRVWNLLTDLYDHAQLADNWAKVDYHDHSPGKGVLIPGEGIADDAIGANHIQPGVISAEALAPGSITGDLLSDGAVSEDELADDSVSEDKLIDGSVSEDKLANSVLNVSGINSTGVARSGKSIIATEETRSVTGYATLTTPDLVSVVLPSDGLIFVVFQGMWKRSASVQSFAKIFLNSNGIVIATTNNAGPIAAPAELTSAINTYTPLYSHGAGLMADASTVAYTGDVTTGQLVGASVAPNGDGGIAAIFAAAGTYDVSIQFNPGSANTLSVKNRKLWVWTRGF